MNRRRVPSPQTLLNDRGMAALESGLALAAIVAVIVLALARS
jgi:hypothetical protein